MARRVKSNPSDAEILAAVLGGLITLAYVKDAGGLKTKIDAVIGVAGASAASAVAPGAIHAWAQAIGLPDCVGQRFVAAHGRLPSDPGELTAWGDGAGLHDSGTGFWRC